MTRPRAFQPSSNPKDKLRRGLSMAALVVLLTLPFGGSPAEASADVRYIAPTSAGRGDGSNWANAAPLGSLPRLVAELSQGGEIRLRADKGRYDVSRAIILGGRRSEAVLTIRGVDPAGRGRRPLLVGQRSQPYSPETAATGGPVFALDSGADHLTFDDLRFRNAGNGFLLRGAVQDLTISDISARNVRRFIENEDTAGATVAGLVLRRTNVWGFSKGAVRLRNDTHDVLIEDVLADSQGQDGDHFAMAFHLTGTVHDVVFRRVVAMNARDTFSYYRNGDGFAAERQTYGLLFEDTKAIDNMDAGYDIKASHVTFVRAFASGNKRNFRLWGSDMWMSSSRATDPLKRGGHGTPAQVWVGPSARFVIEDSLFVGGSSDTIVFDLDVDAVGSAVRTIVQRAIGSRLSRLSEGAEMTLDGAPITD